MKTIKVGVLGFAKVFANLVGHAVAKHPRFELVAVASKSASSAAVEQAFACQVVDEYDAVVENRDIDMVYIPLPNGLHREWVSRSIAAGKHVLCEKSLGCDLSEVGEMVALAREHDRLLVENFQFRFHSQHQTIQSMLAEEVGEIHCFRSSFGFPPFPDRDNIRYRAALGGGALLDAGAYTLKAMQFVMGPGFEVKAATINRPPGHEVDITGSIYASNPEGIGAQLAYGFDNLYQCNYEVWGSRGKLTCTRAFTARADHAPGIILETAAGTRTITLDADDHFFNMLTHFASCLDNGDYEDENRQNLEQARLIEAVKQKSHE